MSSSTWYKLLLEKDGTLRVVENGVQEVIPCKTELNHPDRNWEQILCLASNPGLPSELSSFLWLMFHNILPTKERLHQRNMPNIPNPLCDLCNLSIPDSLQHAFLQCPNNNSAGTFLLDCMRVVSPSLQADQILHFNFDIKQDLKLPIMYIFSSVLFQIWTSRKARRTSNLPNIRASLEAVVQILRKSRHIKASEKLEEILVSV